MIVNVNIAQLTLSVNSQGYTTRTGKKYMRETSYAGELTIAFM